MVKGISPFLWFDSQAEEAANFYVSIFPDSEILNIARYPEEAEEVSGRPTGSVMVVNFRINGTEFSALNGGPIFRFTEAVSFVVNCETQEEIDDLWENLSANPQSEQCGWCKDKYGVSWQIVPTRLGELLNDPDKDKSGRVMEAMLKMKKLDIAGLEEAYNS